MLLGADGQEWSERQTNRFIPWYVEQIPDFADPRVVAP